MYGAKADAIGRAAHGTWGTGEFDKVRDKLNAAVFLVAEDKAATVADIDVPKAYAHPEFIKFVRALAQNPLVA
jgi:hypothetical protein